MYPRFHAEPRSHAILSRMLEWSANEKQALLEHLTRTYTTVMDSNCRFSELDRLTRPLDRHVMLLPQRCVTIQGDFFSPLQGKVMRQTVYEIRTYPRISHLGSVHVHSSRSVNLS